jgi:hypothetical protein
VGGRRSTRPPSCPSATATRHPPGRPHASPANDRPTRGFQTDLTAQVVIAGHAFMQNLRHGHYELGIDASPAKRLAAAFNEVARTI